MRCAVFEQVEERQYPAARAPAAFLDDAEIDPPARRWRLRPAGFSEGRMDVADDGSAVLTRPAAIHRDDIDHHDVAWLVRKQFAAVRNHVERPLGKMHLIAAAGLRGELADCRHQYGVGQGFRQHTALIGSQPPLRRHHVDKRHRSLPPKVHALPTMTSGIGRSGWLCQASYSMMERLKGSSDVVQ